MLKTFCGFSTSKKECSVLPPSENYGLSLAGAVTMTLGTVIGAGIFIMIGPLAVTTGPGLYLTYILALVVAGASSICYAQVATVLPTTAATYRYARLFYTDYVGFLMGWLRWLTSCYGLAIMGIGFANYLGPSIPLDGHWVAMAILTIFFVVNILGLKTTQWVQGFLVLAVLGGLLAFTGWGIPLIRLEHLQNPLEAGLGTLLKGSTVAFFAYTGLYFVAEIGDEIRNPQRTIPLAIFFSCLVLGLLYLAVTLVFSGGLGWDLIREAEPNLAGAAGHLFNPPLAALLQFSALIAVFTPINAIYTSSSRLLATLAKDGFFPAGLARRNRFQAPGWALTVNYVLSLLVVYLNLPLLYLGAISSLITLTGMTLVAGAALKLQHSHPEEMARAPFKMGRKPLLFWSSFTILATIALALTSFWEDPIIFFSLILWLGLGSAYYRWLQGHRLQKKKPVWAKTGQDS